RTDWLVTCGPCKCKWNSGKKTADCKNASISRVPMDLSPEIQVLDMSSNIVPELYNNEFVTSDLRNLHKLFIRNCTLKVLGRDSLKGLEILIELDLSYNLIRTLQRGTFVNLTKLRALMLNNNKLEKLDDGLFRNLKFLHKIELKDNLLVKIEPKAFTNLPVLSQIYLDGNRFTTMNRKIFDDLDKLTSLSLKLNPWNCSCELKSFRDFTLQQNLYTLPTDCYHPINLRGTLWVDVSTDAFACKPEILSPLPDGTTINSSKENVTLSCRVHSSPNTFITWSFNRHSFSNYPKRIFIKNNSESNQRDSMELLTSDLTIVGVKKSDEGTYSCIAENAAGRADVDIVLTVQRNPNESLFLSNNILFIVCLLVVGLFVVSFIGLLITCCYCRKFKKLAKQDLENKKQFETIKLNSFNNGALMANGTTDFEIQKQQHQHNNQQHQPLQQSSNDFIHAEKSEIIGNDTHEIKCVLLGDKFASDAVSFEKPRDHTTGVVLSPSHQKGTYEQHDARFPPDLLPYGQQKIAHANTTTVLENGEYITAYQEPQFFKDNTTNSLQNCSQDLRIYEDCSSGCSVSNRIVRQSIPSSSTQRHTTDTLPCKPRQSIVRASPSFSFLSASYQQQNNFL
ncbi:Leucine-rich repeat-containing protein 24, partial [Pseudolycoriella hygida]